MKKHEAERAIRQLCHQWRNDCGLESASLSELHVSDFLSWLKQRFAAYLSFNTATSVEYDAEMWFDDEFKQNWRR